MAKQTAGFVDQHIEKVVLGVCALVFLCTAAYYFAVDPYQSEGNSAKTLCDAARQAADEAVVAVKRPRPYDPKTDPSNKAINNEPLVLLGRWFGASADGLIKIAELLPRAPRSVPFPVPLLAVRGIAEEDRHGLAGLVAPGTPVLTSGRTVVALRPKVDLEQMGRLQPGTVREENKEVSWVSVGAQVNLYEQLKSFERARYPAGTAMSLPIVRVRLQRQVVGEADAEWEDVDPYTPFKPLRTPDLQFLPGGKLVVASSGELNKFRSLIFNRVAQDYIARTPLPLKAEGTRGDEVNAPPLPYLDAPPDTKTPGPGTIGGPPKPGDDNAAANERVKVWLNTATAILAGRRPFTEPDPEAALILARAAAATRNIKPAEVDRAKKLMGDAEAACKKAKRPVPKDAPLEPEQLMPIVAHDFDVVPGKTYVYRIRYEILNPLTGNERLKDPNDAMTVLMASEWSVPSREVEIKSNTYYFLTKIEPGARNDNGIAAPPVAEFTIYKKVSATEWKREKAKVVPGEPIAVKKSGTRNADEFSTGMVCVDIEAGNGRGEGTVILASIADGTLFERSLSIDSSDKRRKDLEAQATGRRTR